MRWPLKFFFALMNIDGINSQVIYQAYTNFLFLKTLGRELMEELVKYHTDIRIEVRLSIRKYFNVQPP